MYTNLYLAKFGNKFTETSNFYVTWVYILVCKIWLNELTNFELN